MTAILASVATLLAVSVVFNTYLLRSRNRFEMDWLRRETRALDRARSAELRSARQIDAMLERVSTSSRLELDTGVPAPKPDLETRKFVTDEPYMDQAWNEISAEAAGE